MHGGMTPDDLGFLGQFDEDDFSVEDSKPSRKPRRSNANNTAERKQQHNAIERQRRESLNGRFLELAAKLPSMANVKRPSKNAIVNKSIDFIHEANERERRFKAENDTLRREIEQLRSMIGLGPATETVPTPSPAAQLATSLESITEEHVATPPFAIPMPHRSGSIQHLASPVFSDFSSNVTGGFDAGADSDSGSSSMNMADIAPRRISSSSSSMQSFIATPAMMAATYNPHDIIQAEQEIQAHLMSLGHNFAPFPAGLPTLHSPMYSASPPGTQEWLHSGFSYPEQFQEIYA